MGDITKGRTNSGSGIDIAFYRLVQVYIQKVLIAEYGENKCYEILFKAGTIAGKSFCNIFLDLKLDFFDFIAQLQSIFKEKRIGMLRIKKDR